MLIHTFPGAVCVIAVWCSQVGQSPAEIRLHSKSPKSMKTVHNNNKFLALPNMDRKCLRDPCVTKWNLVIFNWINHKHHNLFPQIVIKIFFCKWLHIIIIKYPKVVCCRSIASSKDFIIDRTEPCKREARSLWMCVMHYSNHELMVWDQNTLSIFRHFRYTTVYGRPLM